MNDDYEEAITRERMANVRDVLESEAPKRFYRITGDTLTAFSTVVELPDGFDLEGDEKIRETVAQAIGLRRFMREEDFNVCDVIEVDANGNELPEDRG